MKKRARLDHLYTLRISAQEMERLYSIAEERGVSVAQILRFGARLYAEQAFPFGGDSGRGVVRNAQGT